MYYTAILICHVLYQKAKKSASINMEHLPLHWISCLILQTRGSMLWAAHIHIVKLYCVTLKDYNDK